MLSSLFFKKASILYLEVRLETRGEEAYPENSVYSAVIF